jgi:hypothetical protein
MNHLKSLFYFESRGLEWKVEYFYTMYFDNPYLTARIFVDNELFHEFDHMPSTKISNYTKTHAKELISIAKKIKKQQNEKSNRNTTKNV